MWTAASQAGPDMAAPQPNDRSRITVLGEGELRVIHRVARYGLGTLGLLLGANAAWLASVSNLNVGTALLALAACVLFAWGVWLPKLSRRPVITTVLVGGCAAVVGLSTFLWAHGVRDNARFDEDAVVVLGAAVHGSELSNTLRGRLDAALVYRQHNPDALIVVSGGRGRGEDVSEALAMSRYLLAAGVPEGQIVLEDGSTSTAENFAFSKELLDATLDGAYRVSFVTSEFHVYRAGRIAAAAGLDASSFHSTTPVYFWAPMYLRECLAVVKSWVSGQP